MNIQKLIADWDGKSADYISALYDGYAHESTFVSTLIVGIGEVDSQKGATWLLKKHLEEDGFLTPAEVKQIYALLPTLDHWEAKLHILQSIPFLPIANESKGLAESFLRACLNEQNKFVRAWTFNGWYELAVQHSEYQIEVKQLFDAAMGEEAASVRARIRNIIKQGDLSF